MKFTLKKQTQDKDIPAKSGDGRCQLMFRKMLLILGAIYFFYVSKIEFQEIAETGCIRAKFGYMLCDWTKYAWAFSTVNFGFLCIWTLLRNVDKPKRNKQSITRE